MLTSHPGERVQTGRLNAPPHRTVVEATMERMRMLDMLDNHGQLTTMGSTKMSFDFSPEWARTMAKAREYSILEGAVKIAAVLSREDELCTMQTLDRYNHPDGDMMSLLQAIELVEGILQKHGATDLKLLPWNKNAVMALERAGFKPRTVMQIWQNITEISETMANSGLPMGKERLRSDKYHGTLRWRTHSGKESICR